MRLKTALFGVGAVAVLLSTSGSAWATADRLGASRSAWMVSDSVIRKIQLYEKMKVGVSLFEPWTMCNADGELIGYEIDLANKLAEDMGVEVEFARTDFNYIIWGLLAYEFDVIIAGMGILPDRGLKVNFTRPTGSFDHSIVANKTMTEDLTTLEAFNSASVTLTARRGTTAASLIADRFPDAMSVLFDTDDEVFQAVLDGDAHAAVIYEPSPVQWIEANPTVLYRPFDEELAKTPGAIALRKGDSDAVNFLNGWITANSEEDGSGWLEERWAYWFETREWTDQLPADNAACAQSFE